MSNADELRLAAYATALADAVERAIPAWVSASVTSRLAGPAPDGLAEAVAAAGTAAAADIGGRVRQLLALDIDDQWTNPLALIRSGVTYPTELLRSAGSPPVARDAHAVALHPDDQYDLTPAAFADLGPEVHELGLVWGAAKAHVHLDRRRREGKV